MKKFLTTGGAVLGIALVTGGVYFLTSNSTSFQSNLLADQNTPALLELTTDNANTNSLTGSSIFDATPVASLPSLGTGSVMSGLVMTGTTLAASMEEVASLENLRPAAATGAEQFINTLGLSNTNQNTTGAPVTAEPLTKAPAISETEEQKKAEESLKNLPKVPQTGPESWLLSASILCAMMGMTMLLSAPQK